MLKKIKKLAMKNSFVALLYFGGMTVIAAAPIAMLWIGLYAIGFR